MIRRFLSWVADRFGRTPTADATDSGSEAEGDAESAEDDDSGFIRSRLDANVLTAHGMGAGQVEVEGTDSEEAERLQEADQHRHE